MEPAHLIATDLACRRGERLLFRGLSFALAAGEALQVAGPNGTGKSSLIRILAGLLRPLAGHDRVQPRGGAARRAAGARRAPAAGQALGFWSRIDRGGYGPGR
jgi:heme exporter protein A